MLFFNLLVFLAFSLVAAQDLPLPDLGWVASLGEQAVAEKTLEIQACTNYIATCTGGVPSCAPGICQLCTSLGQTRINSCCAEQTSVECFERAAGIAPATTTLLDSEPAAATDAVATDTANAGATITSSNTQVTPAEGSEFSASTPAATVTVSSNDTSSVVSWYPATIIAIVAIASFAVMLW